MDATADKNTVSPDNVRSLRGLELARKSGARVRHIAGESYFCPSSAGGSAGYVVDTGEGICTCDDFELRGDRCKHAWCVLIVRKEVTVPGGFTLAEKRPTYKQKSWPEYTRVQENEKATVQTLLRGLCDGIAEPARAPKRGNQPLRLSDVVFAAVMKVYSTVSGRRATTDIRRCERDGFIGHAPTHSSIAKFMENPAMKPLLTQLVEESARPLVAVEEHFAADASGFSTTTFAQWHSHKYGAETRVNQWVKAHVMVGVKTHVVTSAQVTAGTEHDSPQFRPMLGATVASGFCPKEASADKGYLSDANVCAIEAVGAAPLVPMKVNSVATGHSEAWRRLHLYFELQREEFLSKYHLRSNVESVFSSVKRKFGASVRSKLPAAQHNEVLCKLIAHNLSMVAHAIGEFSVDPKFWTPRPKPPASPAAPTTETMAVAS